MQVLADSRSNSFCARSVRVERWIAAWSSMVTAFTQRGLSGVWPLEPTEWSKARSLRHSSW